MEKKQLLERMIRRRGLKKYHVSEAINCTRPTFNKLMNDTNLMNGHDRNKIALILGIDVSVIVCIINNKEKELTQLSETILNLINPTTHDNN